MVRGVANYRFYTLVDAYIEATSILRSQSVVPGASRSAMRHLAPFSAKSSPLDDPGRFGYLHTSLSALSHSDVLSGLEIAISRNLP